MDTGPISNRLPLCLITGSSGFIGRKLCSSVPASDYRIKALVRSETQLQDLDEFDKVVVETMNAEVDWTEILKNVDCIFHCAARAHILRENASDDLKAYRQINVAGTKNLAEQAAVVGVRRFIFLSSIGVYGVNTNLGESFKILHHPRPLTSYAISKWEAEQALWKVAKETNLEVVVVRPPLVYGPGVKGNFLRLLQLVSSGLPLPFASTRNKRSLVGLDNLVDLLIRCLDHPRAAGQTLLVSDGHDLSTAELVSKLSHYLNKSAAQISIPVPILKLAGRIAGKSKEIDQLTGSLQVDSQLTCDLLDWSPPVRVEDGLRNTAEWFSVQA